MDGQYDRGFINTFREKPAIIYAPVCKPKKCDKCKCHIDADGICGLRCRPKVTLIEYNSPEP